MSAFADILKAMVERVPGAVGAIFADWEGEMVDQFAHVPPVEIQLAGAHWGIVFNQASKASEFVGMGSMVELCVEGEELTVLVRRVTEHYYVLLQARGEVHLATARRELERSALTLRGEM